MWGLKHVMFELRARRLINSTTNAHHVVYITSIDISLCCLSLSLIAYYLSYVL